ncbi:hypothetical protein [Xanthomonas phage AhaSv]|nr:hypothetical protein [Xanthomonas phage AhaSv]
MRLDTASVAADIAQQIEARAREMRAAGCNWPSIGEFVFLYGEAASAADCADYLSVFDPATAPKFAGAADCGARGAEHCRHSWPHVCDACAARNDAATAAPVTLGQRLMPGCTCGAAERGAFDSCRCD